MTETAPAPDQAYYWTEEWQASSMSYEIWSSESRNLVDWFDTKAELLAALREMSSYEGLRVAYRTPRGKTRWFPALDFAVIAGSHQPRP